MAAPHFELEVLTDAANGVVRFRLRDGDGQQVGSHQVRIGESDAWSWQGLFDTRRHVERYEGGTRYTDHPATAEELLDQLGAFLGGKVLGEEITSRLAQGVHNRTLLVRLPTITGRDEAEDRLAAAFARVPWEIVDQTRQAATSDD